MPRCRECFDSSCGWLRHCSCECHRDDPHVYAFAEDDMAPKKKMTRDEAEKLVAEKLVKARNTITECEQLAEEHGFSFHFSVAYGMGGSYYPAPKLSPDVEAALGKLSAADLKALGIDRKNLMRSSDPYGDDEHGWRSSSQSC